MNRNQFLPASLLLLAFLFGCEPKEDPNRLVMRTDFDVPAAWQLPLLNGRDFWPLMQCVSTLGQGRAKDDLGFLKIPLFEDCIDQLMAREMRDRRNSIVRRDGHPGAYAMPADPAKLAKKPYTIRDCFDKTTLKCLENDIRDGRPFLIHLDGERPGYCLDASYPLAQRDAFLDSLVANPNFLGFETLGEFDADTVAYRFFSFGISNATVKAALRAAYPMPPSSMPEQFKKRDWESKWLATAYRREIGFHFGVEKFWTLYSGTASLGMTDAELGAKGIRYEATTQGANGWTPCVAFTRGASRQFGIPWSWYTANFITAYTRDGKRQGGENSLRPYSKAYGFFGKDRGASRTMMRRQYVYGWFAGAAHHEVENYGWYFFKVDEKGRDVAMSVYGLDRNALWEYQKKTVRGIPYTPIALLTPLAEKYYNSYSHTGTSERWSFNAFLLTLDAPRVKGGLEEARKRGYQCSLFNSPFGNIYDVICPDSKRARGRMREVLSAYKAAFLAGMFRKEELDTSLLQQYVLDGGTLFVPADKVMNGLVDPGFAGVGFGQEKVKSGKTLLEVRKTKDEGRFERREAADLTLAYTVRKPQGTPTARPLYEDENGNVIVWAKDLGKGRIVTVAVDQMLPDRFLQVCEGKDYWEKQSAPALGGEVTFDLIAALLKRVQWETLPFQVDGDVLWGINQVKGKGEGERRWKVWMMNNRGVTKFIGEPEELDASKTATVTIRRGAKEMTVKVAPGQSLLVDPVAGTVEDPYVSAPPLEGK